VQNNKKTKPYRIFPCEKQQIFKGNDATSPEEIRLLDILTLTTKFLINENVKHNASLQNFVQVMNKCFQ
jgi:hypothetical protein